MKKTLSIALVVLVIFSMLTGCNGKNLTTKEDAYNIYYDTIKKFVPELITTPKECDIEIEVCEEVTFLDTHFVRNTTKKIKSQNVSGKLEYYLLSEFPQANTKNFYCINGDKSYTLSCDLDKKGTLVEQPFHNVSDFLFGQLNTPLFKPDAIKSFSTEEKNSNVEISFVIDGSKMEEGYSQRVMAEISPRFEDKLDDVKIVLTIDKNGIPKTMSTEISMSMLNDSGNLYAQKILNMDFTFNKLDNVDFDIQEIISQHALDLSIQ